MSKTRADYGSGIARSKIDDKDSFKLKGQFFKKLRDNTFSGSNHEDANEHIEKVLEIIDLFHIPNLTQDQVMLRAFSMSLTRAASRWLRNKPSGEGVVVTSSSLEMSTNSCLGEKMVSLIFLEGLEEEVMVELFEKDDKMKGLAGSKKE
uniref:Uncharacterized protein n=1 Tax=Tanacetum cinerariifolium TaxID=118510 RepID=A0A699HJX0_TANCI|nr:hypothetical protein [Tanacetum cinerariifolium]